MSTATESEKNASAPEAPQPKTKRTPAKSKSPSRRRGAPKKAAGKPTAEPSNKKAEVIAMMKRAKGATLGEIMKATDWPPHTLRGFISILGSKGGEKIESSKSDAGECRYRITRYRAAPVWI